MESVNEMDLGLSLATTTSVELSTTRDAGANADSNLPTRRLSELVWSTQNGLSIKCATATCTPRTRTVPFLDPLTQMVICNNKGKEKEECITVSSCASISIPDANLPGTSQGPKTAHFLPDATDRFSLSRLKKEDCITAGCTPFLEKIEETAENDVILNTHGESGNINNVISTGNKRWRFEEHMMIESKRIKKESPPIVKQQDSSFMNWISNMVKRNGIDDQKTLNLVTKGLGFQTVFQSPYSQDGKQLGEIESSKSKEIVLFNKTHVPDDDHCLHINEDEILKIPKQIFDTIKKLRLSRTDILKWMNSGLPIENLEGYFLRLRLAKWEEGVGRSGYCVACITASKKKKKSICVKIKGVKCLVESRYISNCEFLQDELVAWWRTNGRQPLTQEKLRSKLDERNKLGF